MIVSKKKATGTKRDYRKLTDFPEHREAATRLAELDREQKTLQHKTRELEAQIGSGDDDTDALRAEAAALVSSDAAVAIAQPDVRVELSAAKQRLAIVTEAIVMQKQAVGALTRECHQTMVDERKPEHAASVERIEEAITQLEQAIREENAVRERMRRDGGSPHGLPTIPTPGNFGFQRRPGEQYAMFHAWRLRMASLGFITYGGGR